MIVAITGANGHIGNNLCRAFLQKGYTVRALIHKNDFAIKNLNITKVAGSLTNICSLEKLIKGADYVIHTAAAISIGNLNKNYIYKVNIEGTQNIVNACLKNPPKCFVHFSSIHALNTFTEELEINENTALALNSPFYYDQSKAKAEQVVLDAVKKGLNAVILNPTSVVGIHDYEPSLLGQTILKIAKNKMPFIISGGYNWVDVKDITEATIQAVKKGHCGERYILSGEWKSLKEISMYITAVTANRKPIVIPIFLAKMAIPFIGILSKISGKPALFTKESLKIVSHKMPHINNEKAKKDLGFNPRTAEICFKDATRWLMEHKL